MQGTAMFQPSSSAYRVTQHADLRWVQRAHEFECRLQQAWRRADAVQLQSASFDQVRHDTETGTILCVRDSELITVLVAEYEQYEPISSETENSEISTKRITAAKQHTMDAACAGGDH
jgi:hypothetical protein